MSTFAEALEFYKNAFNSEIIMIQPYGEYVLEGVTASPINLKGWILHV
ncbi:hypothetical protein [Lacrimispora sp.]